MAKKHLKILSSILLLGLLAAGNACGPSLRVTNLKSTDGYRGEALIYNLPKTKIRIEVEVVKNTYIKGPFYAYAEAYLTIPDAPFSDRTTYYITDIRYQALPETDPDQYYLIETGGDEDINHAISINSCGFLAGFNGGFELNCPEQGAMMYNEEVEQVEIAFTDYSVKRNKVEKTETFYRQVETDSMTFRIPITKHSIEEKKLHMKAEEAANFIIKLRKRKFKLMAGRYDEDIPADGVAVEHMIAKLEELERKYLELFIGKSRLDTHNYVFEYTPRQSEYSDTRELFRFSRLKGVNSKYGGDPVYLKIEKMRLNEALNNYKRMGEMEEASTEGLCYRVPGMAKLSLEINSQPLSVKQMKVAQYGQVLSLPVQLLGTRNYRIVLDPEFGSLQEIEYLGED